MLQYSCPLATGKEKELTTSFASRISRSLLTKAFSAPSALFFQMDTSDSLPDSKLCTLCTLVQATQDSPHHQPPSPSHITSHPPTSPATLILPHHQSPSPPTLHITSHPHPPTSPVTLTPHITSHPHPPTSPVTLTLPYHQSPSPSHITSHPHPPHHQSPLLLLLKLTLQLSHFRSCRQEGVLQLQRSRRNWMRQQRSNRRPFYYFTV